MVHVFCHSYESQSCLFPIPKGSVGYLGCWKWKWCCLHNNPKEHLWKRDLRHTTHLWTFVWQANTCIQRIPMFQPRSVGFGFEFCVCSLTHTVHGTGIYTYIYHTTSTKYMDGMGHSSEKSDGCLGCVLGPSHSFIFGRFWWTLAGWFERICGTDQR